MGEALPMVRTSLTYSTVSIEFGANQPPLAKMRTHPCESTMRAPSPVGTSRPGRLIASVGRGDPHDEASHYCADANGGGSSPPLPLREPFSDQRQGKSHHG